MGVLRRWLQSLFGRTAISADEVVFERIDDAEPAPGAQPAEFAPEVALSSGSAAAPAPIGRSVSIEEIFSRTPVRWRRAMDGVDAQVIVLPPQALLSAGGERPQAYSLRYLAKHYPSVFRDPGIQEADPGVDLPMEFLKDPEADLAALPVDAVSEVISERTTFAVSEEDAAPQNESPDEMRETSKALQKVRLPRVSAGERNAGFNDLLARSEEAGQGGADQGVSVHETPATPAAPNPRLRRILAAYAETLPEFQNATAPGASAVPPRGEAPAPVSKQSVGQQSAFVADAPRRSAAPAETERAQSMPATVNPEGLSVGVDAHRFEELGMSLSRFVDVRGFALWQSGGVMQTGELGFAADDSGMRLRLERMLEGGIQVRGAQDGFCSVTLHGAKGGLSVFGGTGCLVAVAHREDGIPEHLRLWLCGWVSQSRPL
jgi:lipoprotein-anchoring transpeptidase ErfK/SrfK